MMPSLIAVPVGALACAEPVAEPAADVWDDPVLTAVEPLLEHAAAKAQTARTPAALVAVSRNRLGINLLIDRSLIVGATHHPACRYDCHVIFAL
jgi:hypothetical protein